jgi:hypothetical protein
MSAVFVMNPIQVAGLGTAPAAVLFPVAVWAYGISTSNYNTVIAATDVVQTVAASKADRTGLMLQLHDDATLWLAIGRDPVPYKDIRIDPFMLWECPAQMVAGGEVRVRGPVGSRFTFVET